MISRLDPSAWSRPAAAHLLNRAGFGGTPAEVMALHEMGMEKAVGHLLDGAAAKLEAPCPEGVAPRDLVAFQQSLRQMEEDARREARREQQRKDRQAVQAATEWWIGRMRHEGDPVAEKLTFFWHGHFATSVEKVKQAYMMWQQNDTLRRMSLGNFRDMTKAIARDPAMLVWLDTARSNRAKPNENFARELMELFTLGEGHYTEDDIRAAARAFTDYKIDPRNQSFRLAERQADRGEKTLFGQTGNFNADGVIDLVFDRPECAPFIAGKVWKFYASESPNPAMVKALGDQFREGKYEIRPLLETLFTSEAFYDPKIVRNKVKSPVEWLIGLTRSLEIDLPPGRVTVAALGGLGQVPFRPPSVKGWDGGKAWITTATLLLRYNLAGFAVGNEVPPGGLLRGGNPKNFKRLQQRFAEQLPLDRIAPAEARRDPGTLVAALIDRLFQGSLPARDSEAFAQFARSKKSLDDTAVRDLLQLMMSTPQFQLT